MKWGEDCALALKFHPFAFAEEGPAPKANVYLGEQGPCFISGSHKVVVWHRFIVVPKGDKGADNATAEAGRLG